MVWDLNLCLHINWVNAVQRTSKPIRDPISKTSVDAGISHRIKIRQNESRSVRSDATDFEAIRDPVSDPSRARAIFAAGVPGRDFSAAAMIACVDLPRLWPSLAKPEKKVCRHQLR